MNNLQKLFSCISGFEFDMPFTSARDDYYYELVERKASHKERVDHLHAYAIEYVADMTPTDCSVVDEALRQAMTINNSCDRDHLYIGLK